MQEYAWKICGLVSILTLRLHAFRKINLKPKNFRFVVYKLPKLSGAGTSGKEFVYFDAESSDWTRGNDINDPNVAVGATVSQVYSADKSNNFWFMYSDDDPIKSADSYRGHAKGVSLFDSTTGFWLIHSVPNFPPIKSFSYPNTAEKYGQSFFCASMEVQHLTELAEHWKYIQVCLEKPVIKFFKATFERILTAWLINLKDA